MQTTEERSYQLLSMLEGVEKEKPGQWHAICPCHDDNKPSLSIGIGHDGEKLVMHCLAGCQTTDVLKAIDQQYTALFPDKPKKRQSKSSGFNEKNIVAKYDYCDTTGNLIYQVVRFEPKDFRQRRPKPNNQPGWIWSVKNEQRVPYHLSQIVASSSDTPIFIVEGEKDVAQLESLTYSSQPLVATCNAGGAGKWLATTQFTEPFRDRDVVILPDNDDPGRQHAEDVARKLNDVTKSIKVVALPGLTPKSDVSDWIAAGGTAQQLYDLVFISPPWENAPPKVVESDDDPHRLATIIISAYQAILFWRDEFYVMRSSPKDKIYRKVSYSEWRATISKSIKKEFNKLNIEAIVSEPDKTHVCRKVTSSLVSNVIDAMKSLTSIDDEIEQGTWLPEPEDPEGRPQQESWIAMQNGIIKIDELIENPTDQQEYLIPHGTRWFSTVCLPYKFDWDSDPQHWNRYLQSSLESDEERISLLQEWAGYLLTSSTDQQKFLILEGEGSNGKSVYLAAMEALLGPQNVSHVPLEIFGQRFQLTSTLNKLANVCADCGEIDSVAEGYLKSFTSGDRMQFDRKGIAPLDATPSARLMIATNNRPRFSDKSSGLWRRMLLVPFQREIPEEERIAGMDKPNWWTLRPDEMSGIFNWAIAGLQRLKDPSRGCRFTIPQICKDAVDEYKQESNPAQIFLDEFYEPAAYEGDFVNVGHVYDQYRSWCEKNGYRPLANRTFGKEVKRVFPFVNKARRGVRGERFWVYENVRQSEKEDILVF